MFAANTTGYGQPSVSLLNSAGANTVLDSSGGATNGDYYVVTAADGSFSISGDYVCTAGAQVYLYSQGGNPGAGVNSAAGLMAVLGNCPTSGSFIGTVPYVWMNEVSTIAAAYSMAGFATDATHVSSSGSAAALIGIQNAFANPTNLVSTATGVALAKTPAGNGTVQQTQLNALANVLTSCVNSTGPTSANCTTLFNNTLSGGLTGTRATETATAAINIAHNPGVNVAQLYNLANPQVAFAPTLTSAPGDWHLSINYATNAATGFQEVAIDSYGNVWIPTYNGNSVAEFSPLGVQLSGTLNYVGGGLSQPRHIAIDASNNVWVTNDSKNTIGYYAISEFNNSGAALSNSGYNCGNGGYLVACNTMGIDPSGNIWTTTSNNYIDEFSPSGTQHSYGLAQETLAVAVDAQNHVWIPYGSGTLNGSTVYSVAELTTAGNTVAGSPFSGAGVNYGRYGAVDANGSIWFANSTGALAGLSSTGAPLSGSPFTISYSGISNPIQLAVDGANSIWVSNGGTYAVSRLDSSGNLYPGMPFTNGVPVYTEGIAIDGSGNVWVSASGNTSSGQKDTVSQFIGAAAPTVVPIALAVKNNTIGTRP